MTGATCKTENAYPSGTLDFTSYFVSLYFYFHRGSCFPFVDVFLFRVIVLSFEF